MTKKTLDEHAEAVERRNDVPLDRAYANILAAYEAERSARIDLERQYLCAKCQHNEARVRELEAERDALRRRIETTPPWGDAPLSKEEMDALRKRWSFAPEQYQADADALIATVRQRESDLAETRAQLARLREAVAEPDRHHFGNGRWHHTCRVCGAQWMGGPVGGIHPPSKTCALSTPGPTLADIERAAIVRELRNQADGLDMCGRDRRREVARAASVIRQRADDLEAGRE